nr:MAG TPA: hypothetical protein [Caudoviricetes sp.]
MRRPDVTALLPVPARLLHGATKHFPGVVVSPVLPPSTASEYPCRTKMHRQAKTQRWAGVPRFHTVGWKNG